MFLLKGIAFSKLFDSLASWSLWIMVQHLIIMLVVFFYPLRASVCLCVKILFYNSRLLPFTLLSLKKVWLRYRYLVKCDWFYELLKLHNLQNICIFIFEIITNIQASVFLDYTFKVFILLRYFSTFCFHLTVWKVSNIISYSPFLDNQCRCGHFILKLSAFSSEYVLFFSRVVWVFFFFSFHCFLFLL